MGISISIQTHAVRTIGGGFVHKNGYTRYKKRQTCIYTQYLYHRVPTDLQMHNIMTNLSLFSSSE